MPWSLAASSALPARSVCTTSWGRPAAWTASIAADLSAIGPSSRLLDSTVVGAAYPTFDDVAVPPSTVPASVSASRHSGPPVRTTGRLPRSPRSHAHAHPHPCRHRGPDRPRSRDDRLDRPRRLALRRSGHGRAL